MPVGEELTNILHSCARDGASMLPRWPATGGGGSNAAVEVVRLYDWIG